MKIAILITALYLLLAVPVLAQEQVPPTWSFDAFFNGRSTEDQIIPSFVNGRMRLNLNPKESDWGAYIDIDTAQVNGNWLQQANVSKKTPVGQFNGGLIFTAGTYSTPAPFLLRTPVYPNSPTGYGAYAPGVQWCNKIGSWNLKADVSGNSDRLFDDLQFDRAEVSGYAQRSIGGNGNFTLAGQMSNSFTRLTVGNEWVLGQFGIQAYAYYVDDKASEGNFGALSLVEYALTDNVRIYAQGDRRFNGDNVLIPGLGIGSFNNFYFTIGYQTGAENGDGWATRLQWRVKADWK